MNISLKLLNSDVVQSRSDSCCRATWVTS